MDKFDDSAIVGIEKQGQRRRRFLTFLRNIAMPSVNDTPAIFDEKDKNWKVSIKD